VGLQVESGCSGRCRRRGRNNSDGQQHGIKGRGPSGSPFN
jgi:hypothetical protein